MYLFFTTLDLRTMHARTRTIFCFMTIYIAQNINVKNFKHEYSFIYTIYGIIYLHHINIQIFCYCSLASKIILQAKITLWQTKRILIENISKIKLLSKRRKIHKIKKYYAYLLLCKICNFKSNITRFFIQKQALREREKENERERERIESQRVVIKADS